jgi:biopolymer transport protein ExbD
MENNMTTEELKKLYQELEAELERREQEEKNRLRAEKEVRYKEVIDAYENFEELRIKFVEDYGSFTFKTTSNLPHWWNMFSI